MNLVDSLAWLAYFADEPTAEFFAEAIEDHELLIVPSVCIYEVFKVVLRERGEDDAFTAIAAMEQGMVVDLDADLAIESASVGLEGVSINVAAGAGFMASDTRCARPAATTPRSVTSRGLRMPSSPISSDRRRNAPKSN